MEWNIIFKKLYRSPTYKVIKLNIIYQSDNGKSSLTVNALNIDVLDNKNMGGNCLDNSGLHLNSTGYRKLVINFIKKMKILSKN